MMLPIGQPIMCHRAKSRAHEFNIGCCSNQDGCNSNITLKLDANPIIPTDPNDPNIGKKHALKKYDQFTHLNTSCFWGSTGSNITPVMCNFTKFLLQK